MYTIGNKSDMVKLVAPQSSLICPGSRAHGSLVRLYNSDNMSFRFHGAVEYDIYSLSPRGGRGDSSRWPCDPVKARRSSNRMMIL